MEQFEEVYNKYFHDVFSYLRGLTLNETLAEELTEETFFKAMLALNRFREDCDIRVWLCQIAKNCYFTHYKKQKKFQPEVVLDLAVEQEDFDKMLVNKEEAYQIHQILHNLPEPYKEVFSLRVFGELSFQKIGLLFAKSEHWACVTFHRAKQKIQKEMERKNEI